MTFNPTALRKAKIVYNFGLSECNTVKTGTEIHELQLFTKIKLLRPTDFIFNLCFSVWYNNFKTFSNFLIIMVIGVLIFWEITVHSFSFASCNIRLIYTTADALHWCTALKSWTLWLLNLKSNQVDFTTVNSFIFTCLFKSASSSEIRMYLLTF